MKNWFRKLYILIGRFFIFIVESFMNLGIKNKNAVHDSKDYEWAEFLETNYKTILEELNILLKSAEEMPQFHEISPEQKRISHISPWRIFTFFVFGQKIQNNCIKAPETHQILKQIPGLTSAFFSILEPGAEISEHRGPYKGLIRCHLALIIPAKPYDCAIKIDNQLYAWETGKVFIFDDTFIHSAWNRSPEKRVVLFIDIKREMYFPFNYINDLIIWMISHSKLIKEGVKKLKIAY